MVNHKIYKSKKSWLIFIMFKLLWIITLLSNNKKSGQSVLQWFCIVVDQANRWPLATTSTALTNGVRRVQCGPDPRHRRWTRRLLFRRQVRHRQGHQDQVRDDPQCETYQSIPEQRASVLEPYHIGPWWCAFIVPLVSHWFEAVFTLLSDRNRQSINNFILSQAVENHFTFLPKVLWLQKPVKRMPHYEKLGLCHNVRLTKAFQNNAVRSLDDTVFGPWRWV